MSQPLTLAYGLRSKISPLERELFFDRETKTLYIYYNNEWRPIGGLQKNVKLQPGTNLEFITLDDTIDNVTTPDTIRLVDDVDVDTCELGKTNKDSVIRWKGMTTLGDMTNNSFFPLLKLSSDYSQAALLSGKVIIKATWADGTVVYSQYSISVSSTGTACIKGGSESAVKAFICKAQTGSDTQACLYIVDLDGEAPTKLSVWFNGWKNIPDTMLPNLTFVRSQVTSYTIISRENNGK